MEGLLRTVLSCLLAGAPFCCGAVEVGDVFARTEVDAHVRAQFLVYGPLSKLTSTSAMCIGTTELLPVPSCAAPGVRAPGIADWIP